MHFQKQFSQWIISTRHALLKQAPLKQLWWAVRKKLSSCDLCANTVDEHLLLCNHCLHDLPLFRYNLISGDLLNWPAINVALPNIHFDHLFCLAPYQAPFSHWLLQYKYQGRFELSHLLSDLLLQHFLAYQAQAKYNTMLKSIDLILSVPLHITKWQSRGYNQAHLLARPLAHKLQRDYWPAFLQRIIKNVSQVGKDGKQRRKNLSGAFMLQHPLPSTIEHVLLVDDVVTTGSTASEISKILKAAGAKKVTVMAICLSLPKK